ncbi:GntR family transcriptional regulator [Curtobacterium sp. MCLR17_036]|uniref:GntR family transcriptional regulator n=1 Tax=Curtobacterium sp. MCLR17_036 TaxID=2175620 RepID=UPI000DA8CF24|nr:GntR family transcriptional regulator [Curtobacterium sp. MCLR17_036]WIE64548.1 GntR family transcriptional regulator [Curtobacterium sp. MCLR17_036]
MIQIDAASRLPPFEQLRQQLVQQIHGGALRPGQRLPTVRKLAADLGLAPNTVARAYRELESDGLVETRGRNGTVVRLHDDDTERAAVAAARSYVETVRRLGVPDEHAERLVAAALVAAAQRPPGD